MFFVYKNWSSNNCKLTDLGFHFNDDGDYNVMSVKISVKMFQSTKIAATNTNAAFLENYFSIMENPFSLLENHFSLLENHISLVENHFSIFENPFSLLENHFSLLENHFFSVWMNNV